MFETYRPVFKTRLCNFQRQFLLNSDSHHPKYAFPKPHIKIMHRAMNFFKRRATQEETPFDVEFGRYVEEFAAISTPKQAPVDSFDQRRQPIAACVQPGSRASEGRGVGSELPIRRSLFLLLMDMFELRPTHGLTSLRKPP